MNEKAFIRHFGKLMILPVVAVTLLLGRFGVNLTYNQYLIDFLSRSSGYSNDVREKVLWINIFSWLLINGLFFTLTRFYYKRSKAAFLISYFPFALINQFLFSSSLFDLSERSNNYELNSDSGIAWVIIYPVCLVFLFVAGFCFDKMKSRK